MSEKATEKTIETVTNVIIVTEQLEQIDTVEKVLKTKLMLNSYTTNNIVEVKKILSQEGIDIIIIDDAETTIGVGGVRTAIKELRQDIPILQLEHRSGGKADAAFIKNGATIVCAHDDSVAILHNVELLLAYSHGKQTLKKDADTIDSYKEKFDDLYQGLADPVCYVHDGVFLDCNPAFLRTFEITNKEELDELTILNFIDRKHQTDLKTHLRKSTRRDMSANPVLFNMQTKLGKEVEFTLMSKPSKFEDEDAVQIYLRSTSEGGGGGGSLFDKSTGLSNREQMSFFLEQKIQQFEQKGGQGFLAYLMIRNYRDVWGSDGMVEAEKFINAVAGTVRTTLPAHTETARYTDDGLLMYIPGDDPKEIERLLTGLIKTLDSLTPEGMERMVEPSCYATFDVFTKDSDYLMDISGMFRSSRNAAMTEGARVSRPTVTEVAKKDTRRLELLQDILKNESMQMLFQPIASFDPDGARRYRERLVLSHEDEPDMELDVMVSTAERYQMMHRIDTWKMNQLFNRLLEMDVASRADLTIFISLSADSLKNAKFANWLSEQMQHTGLGGKHFVFEFMVDNVINAYSGAMRLSKVVRDGGAQVAVTKVGSLSADNERIINDIKPDIIKLDLREIDTLDDNEEEEVMGDIKAKADEIGAWIIAEYLESPAQLSRIWPYEITFIQGDGMTPLLEDLDFNFDEFAI
ncbi:MAG: hypothetical protein CR974_01415 [Gammaproteobacteria bacterium]|nr:MAG: hypothetical protein CR974_01415 [Gammaproteobacteria bacterium]